MISFDAMDHNKEIINNSDTDSARIHLRSRKEKKQEEDAQNVVTNKRRKGSSKTPANKRPNTSTNKRAKTSSEALYTFVSYFHGITFSLLETEILFSHLDCQLRKG